MIKINQKSDPRIAEDFPNDPYSNLTILTATQKLHLQLAFLTMDSGYFSKIDPDAQQIDLRYLKQEPLIKVLHSLYGQQLVAESISELTDLYQIILYLQIDDYKQTIQEQIAKRPDILQSIEFIELSFRRNLCWEKVVEIHLSNKLKILEDSKNYLQLSKLQNDTFNQLILAFLERYGEAEGRVVNNVMENYFNRKGIKPISYLKSTNLSALQSIWLKHHHVPLSELTPKSSPTLVEAKTFDSGRSSFLSPKSQQSQSVEKKRQKVIQMQKEIICKDKIIHELNQRIQELKKQLGFKPEISKPMTARSLLIQIEGDHTRGRRQSKRLEDLLGQGHEDNESIPDQRKGSAKNIQTRESKVMHRLGSKNMKNI